MSAVSSQAQGGLALYEQTRQNLTDMIEVQEIIR
jgi:hypothetical protein